MLADCTIYVTSEALFEIDLFLYKRFTEREMGRIEGGDFLSI